MKKVITGFKMLPVGIESRYGTASASCPVVARTAGTRFHDTSAFSNDFGRELNVCQTKIWVGSNLHWFPSSFVSALGLTTLLIYFVVMVTGRCEKIEKRHFMVIMFQ